jgi:hypothetical protein
VIGLPDDFERESLYTPSHWFLHDLLELDREAQRVVGYTDTEQLGALVDAQVPWPNHPKHVPGAVAVQMTGTLGNLHAAYLLDLRPSAGWVGYGIRMDQAKFRKMGRIGPPILSYAECTRHRRFRGTWFLDYRFRFEQEGEVFYESTQSAAWVQGDAPLP